MKRFWKIIKVLGVVVLPLTMTSCISQRSPIKIAISAWAGVEPAELAAQLGYYEQYGVDVEMVRFSVYTDSIEALREGKVQAGMHTLDDAIRYFAAGCDVRVVLLTDFSYGGDGIVARDEIDTVTDLAGVRVGVETGTVGHFSLLKALEIGGLNENDITIISIPAWDIKDALLNGEIDAGVTWEPYLTITAENNGVKIIITSRDYPEAIITTMVFDAKTIEQRPKDVQKIVSAYFDAVEYIHEHPQEAYYIMGAAEGISAEEFAGHVEGLRYLDLAGNLELFGEHENGRIYETTNELAQFLADKGVIQFMPDTDRLLEPMFVKTIAIIQ